MLDFIRSLSTPPQERKPLPIFRLCDKVNPQFKVDPVFSKERKESKGEEGPEREEDNLAEGALSFGDKRKDLVKRLQLMLRDLGFALGDTGPNSDGVDENFGDLTRKAVKEFQEKNKHVDGKALTVDGLVGPRTSDSLNRKMVGFWYEKYETPKEITRDFILFTVSMNTLLKGLAIQPGLQESIQVVISDLGEPQEIEIRVRLHDFLGQPTPGATYELSIESEKHQGTADKDGLLIEKFKTRPESCSLTWQQASDQGGSTEVASFSMKVFLNVLDIDNEEGVKRRLHNLGYPINRSLAENIRQFRLEHGLPNSDKLDNETRQAINSQYESGKALESVEPDPPQGFFTNDVGERT